MPYFDVSIPQKVKVLTYYFDKEIDLTGYAVTVPLKNKLVEGIVIDKKDYKPVEVEQIKKIESILGKAYSKSFIDFLKWMSFYYLTETGTVLRATFLDEIISILKGKKGKKSSSKLLNKKKINLPLESIPLNIETLSKITVLAKESKYKTLLIHTPNILYEIKLMIEAVKGLLQLDGTALLIFSEIRDAISCFEYFEEHFIDKTVLIHSEMTKTELKNSIKKIMSNEVKIIVGTRSAIFVPVHKLCIIMLFQESSWLYKAEESPKYHTRDCAIKRGFIENCPVILFDTAPSVTSYYNVLSGKFDFIDDFNQLKHPEIKILRQPRNNLFHPDVLLNLKLLVKEKVLVISPRAGFSLLRCSACGEIIKCDRCESRMIFNKNNLTIKCNRCNLTVKTFESCPYCASLDLYPLGIGVERLKEELQKIFSKRNVEIKDFDLGQNQMEGIFIGQASKIKKTYTSIFKGAVFVDFDFFLTIPDYRAIENAFAKVLSISHLIKEEGIIFIQTGKPEMDIFKFFHSYNFKELYLTELKNRKEANFPPFVRLVKISFLLKKTISTDIIEELKRFLKSNISGEIIGPIKGEQTNEFVFILRSKEKRRLIEDLSKHIDKLKDFKGIIYKIEVDPVSLKI
jgi:primosomal protein N' (replication factor Y)